MAKKANINQPLYHDRLWAIMSRATRISIKATPICHYYNKLLARNAHTKTDKYRKNGDISLIDHLLSIAKKDTHQPKAQFEMINTWDDG